MEDRMNANYLTKERDRITERVKFIDALLDSAAPKSSVLDGHDHAACANKERKDGYWHRGVEFVDGVPEVVVKWIADQSSTDCKYDRKAIDPACAKANCHRRLPGVAYEVTK